MAVTDDAISRIKDMIVAGELTPGDRLPPEKELGETLGLSRSSLREAVKALEVIGVLDVRRGDGTYVTSLQPSILLEVMAFVVDLHRDDFVLQALEVRRMLEPQAAAAAARRITPDQVDELIAALAAVPADAELEVLIEHDVEFHRRIAESTGNTYLVGLLDSLSGTTLRARIWRGITQSGSVARTIDEHRAIANALKQGDAALAHALMTAHVAGVEAWLKEAR
ncbi:FadR/GntR family transcriptional regulator [Ornithinimicrobium pratense]|uniref:FadR family transcriptional regulator n=1 Tax=Ornithinimicrobium pratense TaxID=2593973 RepID=A0A5J6V6H1_9MICO|nr:FadR/GntR family transcriptional regulator [Ornithinimicrobium pratense]QFG69489.1 FadR family transcriptional regulator [Ornithinimicrobium pratense]